MSCCNVDGMLRVLTPVVSIGDCRPALFLDRDDTLTVDVPYLADPAKVELLPGSVEGLRLFREAGYRLILISNQSGVGRGRIPLPALLAVHARLMALLAESGVSLDAAYFCPHAPAVECGCRKPSPGMLQAAMGDFPTQVTQSLMVGDKPADVSAALAAGVRAVQFLRRKDAAILPEGHFAAATLPEIFHWATGAKNHPQGI